MADKKAALAMETLEVPMETPRTRRRSIMKQIDDSDKSEMAKLWMRIKADVKSGELWKLKILFLLHTAALYSLFPFLTIHLKSLGISVAETSIIYTIIPFATIFSPPIMGYVADRIGNFRIFMACMGFISGLIPLTFLLIPNARDRVYLPMEVPVNLSCEGQIMKLAFPKERMCIVKDSLEQLPLSFNFCTSDCDAFPLLEMRENNETTLKITVHPKKIKEDSEYQYQIPKLDAESNSCHGLLKKLNLTKQESTCSFLCEVTVPRDDLCRIPYYMEDRDVAYTFWSMMFLRVFFIMLFAGYMTLMDGAIMAIIKDRNGDLGLQHVWARIGGMIFSPLAGFLMDYSSRGRAVTDYGPSFYLFAALKTASAILISRVDLTFKNPSTTVLQDLNVILRKPELVIFYCIAFLAGMDFGYIENFLFWWLEELGADKSLMGLSVTVGTASGIPWLILAGLLINKFGHINVISFALFAYAVRLVGYSFINDPYMCLPFEALECFTSSLMMTAFDLYAAKLSTMSTIASVMGLMGAMHYGFGRGLGSLTGGLLMQKIGMRTTFRLFSVCSLVLSIIYCLYYFCYIRRRDRKQEKKEKQRKPSQ